MGRYFRKYLPTISTLAPDVTYVLYSADVKACKFIRITFELSLISGVNHGDLIQRFGRLSAHQRLCHFCAPHSFLHFCAPASQCSCLLHEVVSSGSEGESRIVDLKVSIRDRLLFPAFIRAYNFQHILCNFLNKTFINQEGLLHVQSLHSPLYICMYISMHMLTQINGRLSLLAILNLLLYACSISESVCRCAVHEFCFSQTLMHIIQFGHRDKAEKLDHKYLYFTLT